ncbi:GDSL esterase/lipase At5g41890-like [Cryptomeria japonica]|uniref:GDSL esterase/lipase At5g41890-like n=1 Tax=Cryptomeria japonica TaxID=3369 RepID=UPI0027DA3D46|nr:GDSL esterase/lipase At5g41890-like [Cryptomeria japonica]
MTSFLSISINLFLVGWILSCFNGVTASCVPAMYVFGDSLGDAGTNSFIPRSTVRANFPPYGVSFFPYPTGRFTNGRTAFDFLGIATSFLGLPRFPPPFLKPKENFSTGINFASGGSGLLDSTGPREKLYRVGARKFLVFDISTIGCTPVSRLVSGNGECLDAANQLAVAYNTALKPVIDQLNEQLDGLSLILLNSFDYVVDMIQHGEAYGLSETSSACCGSGAFNAEETSGF